MLTDALIWIAGILLILSSGLDLFFGSNYDSIDRIVIAIMLCVFVKLLNRVEQLERGRKRYNDDIDRQNEEIDRYNVEVDRYNDEA